MPTSLDFLNQTEASPLSAPSPSRRLPAWVLPAAITLGFSGLFLTLFSDRLLPARRVETLTVLATTGETVPITTAEEAPRETGAPASGRAMIFQASGWIEPSPLPVKATALVDGVIAEVAVQEGQSVEKGTLLARLVDDDARLALEAARQRHRMLVSARAAHVAGIEGARKKREAAEAEASAIHSQGDEARDILERFGQLPKNAVSRTEVNSARLRVEREHSLFLAAQAKSAEVRAEEERLALETAAKDDETALAAVAVRQAELNLARTRITAPITGRVLRLLAAPGDKKILAMDHEDSSTVGILYAPEALQVRVDVPLADAAKMQPGQHVRIHCGLLPDRVFSGEVMRITGEADVQRNTLQAKVRIDAPAGQLRPEMLCRVEFLAEAGTGSAESVAGPAGGLTLWVHRDALLDGTAWVYDPESKRVTKRGVRTGPGERDGYVRVTSGLRPGEQTVINPAGLSDRQRVKPTNLSE